MTLLIWVKFYWKKVEQFQKLFDQKQRFIIRWYKNFFYSLYDKATEKQCHQITSRNHCINLLKSLIKYRLVIIISYYCIAIEERITQEKKV